MKQATGELNGSVITVMAVATLTVLFFTVIWPMIRANLENDSQCSSAVCDNGFIPSGENEGMAYCYNRNDPSREPFMCPFRG